MGATFELDPVRAETNELKWRDTKGDNHSCWLRRGPVAPKVSLPDQKPKPWTDLAGVVTEQQKDQKNTTRNEEEDPTMSNGVAVTFLPRDWGFSIDTEGIIVWVSEDDHAASMHIKPGDKIITLNNAPFSINAFQNARQANRSFVAYILRKKTAPVSNDGLVDDMWEPVSRDEASSSSSSTLSPPPPGSQPMIARQFSDATSKQLPPTPAPATPPPP